MIRLMTLIFYVFISACSSQAVNKPTLLWNAESYTDDAMQAYVEEDWNRAEQLFQQGLSLYQSLDDRLAVLASHINLVEVALAKHDAELAEKQLQMANAIVKMEALTDYQSRISLLYARVAIKQKQLSKGSHLLQAILPANDSSEAVSAIQLVALASRTEIAFKQKQDEFIWLQRYGTALENSGYKTSGLEARLFRFQAELLIKQTDYVEADSLLQQALLMYKNKHSRTGIADTLFELGKLNKQQAAWAQAINYFNRAITVFRSLADDKKVAECLVEINKLSEVRPTIPYDPS